MKGFLFSLTMVLVVLLLRRCHQRVPGDSTNTCTTGVILGGSLGLQYFGPTPVDGVPGTIVQISTSNSASYALTKAGEVWAWGVGVGGALGNGTMPKSTTTPVQVKFPAASRSLRSRAQCRLTPVWRSTATATSGAGAQTWRTRSVCRMGNLLLPMKLPLTHVTQASGAGAHGLYVSDGKLYACGGNTSGELGDGTTAPSTQPVRVVGLPDQSIRAIGSSWEGSGALMADGSYYDWGYNHADQLGDGTTTNSDTPVRVNLPAKVRQVSLGGSAPGRMARQWAILANGSVWAWGQERYGQLGNGKVASSTVPTPGRCPSWSVPCPGHLRRIDPVRNR